MENLEEKLKNILNLQKNIEERIKFLEDNYENLSDQQLEDLTNAALQLEESLFPEVDKIKEQMEEKKQEFLKNAQNQNKPE
jgi:hypothetical protein